MKTDSWKIWDSAAQYGELLYKRAIGESEEMESAKAVCKVLADYYQKGMSLLDVGCGAGHYLRSLRDRLDENINYTGVDATENFLNLAKKAFGENVEFKLGDIHKLPLENNSFDIVMNNNVILHLPPPPEKAISELIRVSRKYTIIRVPIGKRNYIIKEIRAKNETPNTDEAINLENSLVTSEDKLSEYNYFNLYTVDYFRSVINSIDTNLNIQFIDDKFWSSFDNTKMTDQTGTKVVGDYQISGNLLLDWKFIVIEK